MSSSAATSQPLVCDGGKTPEGAASRSKGDDQSGSDYGTIAVCQHPPRMMQVLKIWYQSKMFAEGKLVVGFIDGFAAQVETGFGMGGKTDPSCRSSNSVLAASAEWALQSPPAANMMRERAHLAFRPAHLQKGRELTLS